MRGRPARAPRRRSARRRARGRAGRLRRTRWPRPRRRRRAAGRTSCRCPMPPDCAEAKPIAATAPTPVIDPESHGRTLVAAQDGHRCGRRRQQRDDDRAVAGGSGGEREGGQQREADHDAAGDHREPRPLAGPGQALPGHRKGARGEDGRDDRPARADEQRRQAPHRHPGERNGEGERCDSEQPPPQPGCRRQAITADAQIESSATMLCHE